MNTPGHSPEAASPQTRDDSALYAPSAPREHPARIGRYRIEKVLGEGGFGRVYLAHDDQLGRPVAIKVPRPERLARPQDAEAYLAEARVVASLDHPHIVPVYDVGASDGLCFVVSKLIEGSDLARRIRERPLSHRQAAELAATVADALHHAHARGLVHRDVKPGNILLDAAGKPYVADFGLALKEADFGKGVRFAGTPAYMSPEQARGEGHRVDGRSDVFSLGVVLYELLTGRRPFYADSQQELLEQVCSVEPRPPRQWADAIPRELERICLKALGKRASERYTTAKDLADDLRHFLTQAPPAPAAARADAERRVAPGPAPTPTASPSPSDQRTARIVPKGLRPFDAHDADFFLELLPGPRDCDGLPDSLRFWKARVEETDADQTFPVGLIYGPSGCGKSSLVRAGLLPRLSEQVIAVYVEATAAETESRLLGSLRRRCPALPASSGLRETLAAIRRGIGMPAGAKVLIVLDQFEQWLHARRGEENTELVQALRQCDGGRVQCVVLVRDDFWLAVSRFLRELEVPLVEGRNSALVDLFDTGHAAKVLTTFGRAYGRVPEQPAEVPKEASQFIDQAVVGLAQGGKVICVRLALFAEMMKGKPWTPATLREAGGPEGIGVAFLEETFGAAAAPERRYHQKAARGVLKALLPEPGADIKGHMRSRGELLEASGYAGRPRDFDDLLRILDTEVRLITPTDPEGKDEAEEAAVPTKPGETYYQLTHDYLVPSLRDWLTRKQRETRRGRAELLLADRAALWNARPEARQLPSLWQWLRIRSLTRKALWAPPELAMMRQAARHHGVRALVVATALILLAVVARESFGRMKAETLRDRVLESNTADVPAVVADLAPYRRWVDPLLREAHARAVRDNDRRRQLHASLALLPVDAGQIDYLLGRLLEAEPQELLATRQGLLLYKVEVADRLWAILGDEKADLDRRFRAACALAAYTPDDPRWARVGGDVAARLVVQNGLVLGAWAEVLGPVAPFLLPPLASILEDERRSAAERNAGASLYRLFAKENPDTFAPLERVLAEQDGANGWNDARAARVQRHANVAVALAGMGRTATLWPLLRHTPDPTLRSYLIDRLAAGGVDPKVLVRRLAQEPDVSARRALLLSLGEYGLDRLPPAERQNLVPELLRLYRDNPDPGVHGAAGWLLRRWQADGPLAATDAELATGKPEGNRRWYVNRQRQTMAVVSRPGVVELGEAGRLSRHRIDHGYSVATCEVTVERFLRFRKDHPVEKKQAPTPDCPVHVATWYDAAAYCNWLSEREGIARDQWCYEPNEQGEYAEGMKLAPNWSRRTGYRLPTEAEWEHACRAGAATAYGFGDAEELLDRYAWFAGNSPTRSRPVGTLRPNDLGLFDMHGNVWEWTQDAKREWPAGQEIAAEDGVGEVIKRKFNGRAALPGFSRVVRGGSYQDQAASARSAERDDHDPPTRFTTVGFRVARTVR